MLISHSHRFIYFAPQKTGSTSLRQVLVERYGAELLGSNLHAIHLPADCQDYFTFCTVRNPYTRALSAYNYLVGRGELKERIEDCCTIGDWHWARSVYSALFERPIPEDAVPTRLDAFIKMENMGEGFNSLPFVTDPVEIPSLNQSEKHRVAYGPKVFEFVRRFHSRDFQYFGYPTDWRDLDLKILI